MFRKFLFLLLPTLAFTTNGYAQLDSTAMASHALIFQVIQDEFTIDNQTVKNAAIIENESGYQGLNIELKPEAVKIFTEMTTAGSGRQMNLLFNKVLVTVSRIQTPLGGNFLISGITKQDAQAFLYVLNANKPKKTEY